MSLPANYKQVIAPATPTSQRLKAPGGSSSSKELTNQNPFITNPHGNPAFHPQKVRNTGDARIPKPPKPPEKPLMPYMRYSRKIWDQVKTQNPDKKIWEIGKIIGHMWRELPESDKAEYASEFELEKLEYEKKVKLYETSPAYLAYVAAKSKGKLKDSADDTERSTSGKQSAADRRIDIQPAEDEEDLDDGFSAKHMAYARYLRNHRLINEIFSDTVVPDVRSVVTTGRMQVLKRQVHSLTMHQKKLEAELQAIEDKFQLKKRKFMESSEAFHEEMKRQCQKVIDEQVFEKMVQEQLELLKKEKTEKDQGLLPAKVENNADCAPVAAVVANNIGSPSMTSASSQEGHSTPSSVSSEEEINQKQDLQQPGQQDPAPSLSEQKLEEAEAMDEDQVQEEKLEEKSENRYAMAVEGPLGSDSSSASDVAVSVQTPPAAPTEPVMSAQGYQNQHGFSSPVHFQQGAPHPYPTSAGQAPSFQGQGHVPPVGVPQAVSPTVHSPSGQQTPPPLHPQVVHPHAVPAMQHPQNQPYPYQYPVPGQPPLSPKSAHHYGYPQTPYPQYPPHPYYQAPYPQYSPAGHIPPTRPHAQYPPHVLPSTLQEHPSAPNSGIPPVDDSYGPPPQHMIMPPVDRKSSPIIPSENIIPSTVISSEPKQQLEAIPLSEVQSNSENSMEASQTDETVESS